MSKPQDYVVLLHGLARTRRSFWRMERVLNRSGFRVVNANYPSTRYPIEVLADDAISAALSQCQGAQRVHFVTHSMGGILLRQYLSQKPIENLGRVVMLGPPNQGSEIVDVLGGVPGFKLINGPAGLQLGTSEHSVPNRLGDADFELGVIAGNRTVNLLLSRLLPKPNDGKVSLQSTRLKGMKAHLVLPVTHSFMMQNRKVIEQSIHFLQKGAFLSAGSH